MCIYPKPLYSNAIITVIGLPSFAVPRITLIYDRREETLFFSGIWMWALTVKVVINEVKNLIHIVVFSTGH